MVVWVGTSGKGMKAHFQNRVSRMVRRLARSVLGLGHIRKFLGRILLLRLTRANRVIPHFGISPCQETIPKDLDSLPPARLWLPPKTVKSHQYMVRFPGAFLSGRGALGFDSNGRLILETIYRSETRVGAAVSRMGWRSQISAASGFISRPSGRVKGDVVSLASNWDHYGHWVPEHLLKLQVVAKETDLGTVTFVIRGHRGDFKHQFLHQLGIRDEQIMLWAPWNYAHQVENLLVPTYPQPSEKSLEWARSTFCGNSTKSLGPLVYLSRERNNDERVLKNRDEVESVLQSLGFATFHPQEHTVAEQISVFNEARVLFGLHGSAMANIIFSEPGATLVEAFGYGVFLDFRQLAIASGHRHIPIVGKGFGPRRQKLTPKEKAVHVDPSELLEKVGDAVRGVN